MATQTQSEANQRMQTAIHCSSYRCLILICVCVTFGSSCDLHQTFTHTEAVLYFVWFCWHSTTFCAFNIVITSHYTLHLTLNSYLMLFDVFDIFFITVSAFPPASNGFYSQAPSKEQAAELRAKLGRRTKNWNRRRSAMQLRVFFWNRTIWTWTMSNFEQRNAAHVSSGLACCVWLCSDIVLIEVGIAEREGWQGWWHHGGHDNPRHVEL